MTSDQLHPAHPEEDPASILLVEDEETVRRVMYVLLTLEGYSVLAVGTGEEALTVCQQHSDTIRLLLTDIMMAGMDGFELAQQVTQLYPHIKVICLSGQPRENYANKKSREGEAFVDPCTHFMLKPFEPGELLELIAELLGR